MEYLVRAQIRYGKKSTDVHCRGLGSVPILLIFLWSNLPSVFLARGACAQGGVARPCDCAMMPCHMVSLCGLTRESPSMPPKDLDRLPTVCNSAEGPREILTDMEILYHAYTDLMGTDPITPHYPPAYLKAALYGISFSAQYG